MLPEEKKDYFKVGNTYIPFIDKAYQTVCDHPEIMSGLFNMDEYKKDYQLSKDLQPILTQINELSTALQSTIFAVQSDCMAESLEIYSSVQQNKDRVAGLNAYYDDLKVFFKKTFKVTADKQ